MHPQPKETGECETTMGINQPAAAIDLEEEEEEE